MGVKYESEPKGALCEGEHWAHFARNMDEWRALLNTVTNLRV
jgi:hypothetical protein